MKSSDLNSLADAIKALAGKAPALDGVLAAGKVVVEVCFGGDAAAFSSRSPKSPSLRAAMQDPRISALHISRRTLGDYARVYIQSLDLPQGARALDLGHRLKLLPLPIADQHALALQAVASKWTVRELGRELRRRCGPGKAKGAQVRARGQATRAASLLTEVRLADLTDGALVGLAAKLASVVTSIVGEAESRGLDLGLSPAPGAASPGAGLNQTRRQSRGDGPLVDAYRPMLFSEVVGQTKAVEDLRVLARSRSRLPILLHGSPGTGKTTLARIYCRAWVCKAGRPDGSDPCNACDVCEQTAQRPHQVWEGGLYEGSAAASGDAKRAAEDVLDALSVMWDGYIVNEAERLLIQQQRLLAWIEAQSRPVVFCTTDITKFDAQFRSRCVIVEVAPVTEPDMVAFLAEIAEAESVKMAAIELHGFLRGLGPTRAGQVRDVLVAFEPFLARHRHRST